MSKHNKKQPIDKSLLYGLLPVAILAVQMLRPKPRTADFSAGKIALSTIVAIAIIIVGPITVFGYTSMMNKIGDINDTQIKITAQTSQLQESFVFLNAEIKLIRESNYPRNEAVIAFRKMEAQINSIVTQQKEDNKTLNFIVNRLEFAKEKSHARILE